MRSVTPTATIGVRGTAFDVYVGDTGELAIAMINGAVEVCPMGGACRLHNIVGRFLHMSVDGIFSLHDAWDGSFLNGVTLKTALPFIDDQRLARAGTARLDKNCCALCRRRCDDASPGR